MQTSKTCVNLEIKDFRILKNVKQRNIMMYKEEIHKFDAVNVNTFV